jgi:CDGSH-type Zn-finger protein/uncharacterized Fe-S cluster protein YjdI
MTAKEYAGKEVVISFDARRCIHAAECVRGAPSVFNPDAKPWIAPDGASGEHVAQVVRRCPTGALSLRFNDGRAAEVPDAVNSLTISANGPLYLRGQLTAHAQDGSETRGTRMALCRCGASANKPFCDGAHNKLPFADAGVCQVPTASALHAPEGPVAINPKTNGPLMVQGWLEFVATDGARFVGGDQTWLCRCGHSQNKPFCDGSHKAAGFQG